MLHTVLAMNYFPVVITVTFVFVGVLVVSV
jgi:hypothetical protein